MCHESRAYFFQIYGTYFIFMIYDIIYLNSFHLFIVNAYTGQNFTQIYNSFQWFHAQPLCFSVPQKQRRTPRQLDAAWSGGWASRGATRSDWELLAVSIGEFIEIDHLTVISKWSTKTQKKLALALGPHVFQKWPAFFRKFITLGTRNRFCCFFEGLKWSRWSSKWAHHPRG